MTPPPSGGRWGRAPSPARQRERGREREREKERERWAGEESLRPGRAGWIEPRRRRQRDCAAVLAANACRTPCCLSLQLPPPPLCCLSPAPSGCKEASRSAGGSLSVGATGPATDGGCAIAPPLCEAGGGGETGRLGGDLASWAGGGGARADLRPWRSMKAEAAAGGDPAAGQSRPACRGDTPATLPATSRRSRGGARAGSPAATCDTGAASAGATRTQGAAERRHAECTTAPAARRIRVSATHATWRIPRSFESNPHQPHVLCAPAARISSSADESNPHQLISSSARGERACLVCAGCGALIRTSICISSPSAYSARQMAHVPPPSSFWSPSSAVRFSFGPPAPAAQRST